MAFNLVEAEGLQDVWDETIEFKRDPIPFIFPDVDRSDEGWETKQDEYHCWSGTRLPQWM